MNDLLRVVLVTTSWLCLFEAAISLTGANRQASFYAKEAERGYAFRPFAHGWEVTDGRNYCAINSRGYHDREHAFAKESHVVRIATLGSSSYVAAMNVPTEQSFVTVIEQTLNRLQNVRAKIEIFNFGVEAYSSVQSFQTLQKDVWQYHPDLVLFAVTYLDPLEAYRGSAVNTSFDYRPYFEVNARGEIVPDSATRSKLSPDLQAIAIENRLNDLVNQSSSAMLLRESWKKAARVVSHRSTRGPGTTLDFPLEQPRRIFTSLLLDLKKEAKAHNAELWLVTIPIPEQDNPDPTVRQGIQQAIESGSNHHLFFSDAWVDAAARDRGIHSILLSPNLASYAEQHHVYLHGFANMPLGTGHWNELGNRVAGEHIAGQLAASSPILLSQR